MKIGILTERMVLGFGVDLVVHEQASRLGRLGHEVAVFVIRADPLAQGDHYALHTLSNIVPGVRDFSSEATAKVCLDRIDAETYDVWILHTPPFYAWIRYLDTPVVFVEYGTPPAYFFDDARAYRLWKATSDHLCNDYSLLRPADAVVSISQDIHNWLPTTVQPWSSVIRLGADHYGQVDDEAAGEFRKRLGVSDYDRLILWVGRMQIQGDEQPYKGFRELCELIPAIKAISTETKIALLGKVREEDARFLKSLGVIVLANHPPTEMGTAYAAADILLNLSKWEGFNLALVEAQFQGTPAVAYDIGPHDEVTIPNKTAILSQTSDEIISALTRLIRDSELLEGMSAESRIFARTLTWDSNVKELELVLERCRRLRQVSHQERIQLVPFPNVSPITPPLRFTSGRALTVAVYAIFIRRLGRFGPVIAPHIERAYRRIKPFIRRL